MRRESKVEVKRCARFIFYVKDWTGKAGVKQPRQPRQPPPRVLASPHESYLSGFCGKSITVRRLTLKVLGLAKKRVQRRAEPNFSTNCYCFTYLPMLYI